MNRARSLQTAGMAGWERPGTGRRVIFLHGNSCSGRSFSRQFDAIWAEDFHLISLDLPGHGESPPLNDPTEYCLPEYASKLIMAAEASGWAEAIWVGWSLGGHVLWEAMTELPNPAGFLLVAAPPLSGLADMATAFRSHEAVGLLTQAVWSEEDFSCFAKAVYGKAEEIPAMMWNDLKKADGRARAGLGQSLVEGRFHDEIQTALTTRIPIGLILGEHDPFIAPEYYATLKVPTLWRSKLQRIPAAGHAPHWENHEEFNRLLAVFCQDLRP